MDSLSHQFDAVLGRIGLTCLPCDVYDTAAFTLRFSIGGSEAIYLGDHRKPNGAYIENAVDQIGRAHV